MVERVEVVRPCLEVRTVMHDRFVVPPLRKKGFCEQQFGGGVRRGEPQDFLELANGFRPALLAGEGSSQVFVCLNDVSKIPLFPNKSVQFRNRFVQLSLFEQLDTERQMRPRCVGERLPQVRHRLLTIPRLQQLIGQHMMADGRRVAFECCPR